MADEQNKRRVETFVALVIIALLFLLFRKQIGNFLRGLANQISNGGGAGGSSSRGNGSNGGCCSGCSGGADQLPTNAPVTPGVGLTETSYAAGSPLSQWNTGQRAPQIVQYGDTRNIFSASGTYTDQYGVTRSVTPDNALFV